MASTSSEWRRQRFILNKRRHQQQTGHGGATGSWQDGASGMMIPNTPVPGLGQAAADTGPKWSGGLTPIYTHQQQQSLSGRQVGVYSGPGAKSPSTPLRPFGQTVAGGAHGPRTDTLFGGEFKYNTGTAEGYESSKMWESTMSMGPAARAELIQFLVDAGLLDESKLTSRTAITSDVFAAWDYVAGQANGNGTSITQEMDSIMSMAQSQGVGKFEQGYQVPPLTVQLKDPEYLRKTFKETSYRMLGQHLPADQIQKQVDAYQDADRAYQTEVHMAQYGQDPAEAGTAPGAAPAVTEITAPPTEEEFFEGAVWDLDKEGAEAHGFLSQTAQHFFNSLGGQQNLTRQY